MKRKRKEALKQLNIFQINMFANVCKVFIIFVLGTAGGVSRIYGQGLMKKSCAGLPDKLDFDHKITLTSTTNSGEKSGENEAMTSNNENVGDFWTYRPSEATLALDLTAILYLDDKTCLHENQTVSYFKIDLISVNSPKEGKGFKPSSVRRCRTLSHKHGAYVQDSTVVNSTHPFHTFFYVQGSYYLRLSLCHHSTALKVGDSCVANMRHPICSQVSTFIAHNPKNEDVCHYEAPTNLTIDVRPKSRSLGLYFEKDRSCEVTVKAILPVCTSHQPYDKITVAVVPASDGRTCSFDDYNDYIDEMMEINSGNSPERSNRMKRNGTTIEETILKPCSSNEDADDFCLRGDNNSNLTGANRDNSRKKTHAYLEHSIGNLWRNSTYCVFFRPRNPHCTGDYGCLFYTRPLRCDELIDSRMRRGRQQMLGLKGIVTEPVFIGVVSATLFLSLALLMWTVIQCSKGKNQGSPINTSGQNGGNLMNGSTDSNSRDALILKKAVPKSLTEDDLEHISRLPSQEIVLVYFPDTKRFKDLNRKLRNWLITLDVNDVKDIYDEKCSEEVLKNPDQWVRDTFGGPEKRIILVCSRLAYECLHSVKRRSGIDTISSYMSNKPLSPRFVETDPHFGLLTRAISYIDREMRGNYRNLICVRYEDIKICARSYSSEAFNIVPGTEYVLPQHLEDIYRWIHPRNPRPEYWSPDARPEVRELLDMMRQYRHHDDNIFTVQFATPCNGVLSADITPPGNDSKDDADANSTMNVNTPLIGGKDVTGTVVATRNGSVSRH